MTKKPKLESLLLHQTKIDLIFDVDLINDMIDVRNTKLLEIKDDKIIVSQTSPPVLKSLIRRTLEATFVRQDPTTSEIIRWGWRCQIKEILTDYKLRADDTEYEPAFSLTLPVDGDPTETNARLDFRLNSENENHIIVQTHPSFGRVILLNFSAGGMLIGVPSPVQATEGTKLWFTLFFPDPTNPGHQNTINGEASVVRVLSFPSEPIARIGLKFLELDLNASRTLQKTINYYMLEAQRHRD